MNESTIKFVELITPFTINFILLFCRKKRWVRNQYKWIFFSILGVFNFYQFINNFEISSTDQKLIEWGWITPLVFSLVDLVFMKLSYLFHNRDFYLWLRGSSEIDDTRFSGGSHVHVTDRIFSIFLLFSVIFLPVIILLFL